MPNQYSITELFEKIKKCDTEYVDEVLRSEFASEVLAYLSPHRMTLLEYAVQCRCEPLVQSLLIAGGGIADRAYERYPGFFTQAFSYDVVLHSPDIFTGGVIVFLIALDKGDIAIASLLYKYLIASKLSQDGLHTVKLEALFTAVKQHNIEAVRFVLDLGVDISHIGRSGYSVLSIACAAGDLDIVRLLLDQGADINTRTAKEGRYTCLMEAIYKGHEDVAMELLERGADFTVVTTTKSTAHSLAKRSKLKSVLSFIESHTDH